MSKQRTGELPLPPADLRQDSRDGFLAFGGGAKARKAELTERKVMQARDQRINATAA